jgi:hypothetical protein
VARVDGSGDEGEQAIERTQAFARLMVEGGADDLEALLAPGFTYTHRSGRVETLDEILGAVRGGRRYGRMDLEELSARSYAGASVVQGIAHMRGGSGASLIEFDSRFSAAWVDVDGTRRLAVYHSTGLD